MAGGSGGLIDSNRQAWQVAAELQTQNGTGGNGTACSASVMNQPPWTPPADANTAQK